MQRKHNRVELPKLNKLSQAVLLTLGAASAYAGPGSVPACDDSSPVVWSADATPVASCTPGKLISIPTYYANSPILRKFVDDLPGLTPAGTSNTLGQYIPVATAEATNSYPNSDYYELAVVEYSQKMHTDLQKPTRLRGYVQIDRTTTNAATIDANGNVQIPANAPASAQILRYPAIAPATLGNPILVAKEKGLINGVWDHSLEIDPATNKPVMVPAIAYDKPHYLGPTLIANKGTPTRIKMNNLLPQGAAGAMFLPVDESLPGVAELPGKSFPQNRVAIHLHGGDSPWISDGTPNQWFSAERTGADGIAPLRGDRAINVPDMPDPGENGMTLFWPNDQSSRLMWYHDHTFGLTRQNAYAGMAAGYLINDAAENTLLGTDVPAEMIPLIIQDKTFVPNDIAAQDALWDQNVWGKPGDLWFPHVYEPAVIYDKATGNMIANPAGRWDYAPTLGFDLGAPYSAPLLDMPAVSTTPEAYMDTSMVNGVAYPKLTVDPKAYRVRFLNGANDRYLNMSLYVADSTLNPDVAGYPANVAQNTEVKMLLNPIHSFSVSNGGSGYVNPQVTIADANGGPGTGATATATVVGGVITAISLTYPGEGYVSPQVTIMDQVTDPLTQAVSLIDKGATATALVDLREGGIPDPVNAGPAIIQFGNESGLLPQAVVHNPKQINLNDLGEVINGGFYLGNAERADTVIDFSQYAGKTLILYSDSTSPVPGGDPNYDNYTNDPDHTANGGAPSTKPGYGPNTRTIMQINVSNNAAAAAYDKTNLDGKLATFYAGSDAAKADERMIATNANGEENGNLAQRLKDLGIDQTALKVKTIEGLNDVNFGRLIANFTTEDVTLPGAGNVPMGYIDKPTDIVSDGELQYWWIKNIDADNHPIHFHLFNVQVIGRVQQDANKTFINPLPTEAGWKETVQNWPGQDVIVALKPKTPLLPFGLPNSVRLMDPSMPADAVTNHSIDYTNATGQVPYAFLQYDIDPNTGKILNASTSVRGNEIVDYAWEYVFHCHILGHEENDLMRPMVFKPKVFNGMVPAATGLSVANGVVSWNDPTPAATVATKGNENNEIGFLVERAPIIDGVTQGFAAVPTTEKLIAGTVNTLANATAMNDTPPDAHTDYSYRVSTVHPAGNAVSGEVTLAQAPLAPTGLATQNLTPRRLDVLWTDVARNEEGYVVEYSTDGNTWTAATSVGAGSASLTGLTPGVTYSIRVGASKTGFAPQYTVITATTPAELLQATGLTAGFNAVGAPLKSVTLNWTDASTAESGYLVQRAIGTVNKLTGAVTWTAVTNLPTLTSVLAPNLQNYVDSGAGVTNDRLYQYRISAVSGLSAAPAASVDVLTATTMAGISKLQANGPNTVSTVPFQWQQTTSALATGYEISRCVGTRASCSLATATWQVLPARVLGSNTIKFTDSGLASKTTYNYRVRAGNWLASNPVWSAWSGIYTGTTR